MANGQCSIIPDREFFLSKQVLEGKAKLLCKAGLKKQPNKARQVSAEVEEILCRTGKFCSKSSEALVQTMWWLSTQHFGLCGRQEHHGMRLDDFCILKAVAVVLSLSREVREFIWHQPSTLQQSCPFYFAIKTNQRCEDEIWYKTQSMEVNKINSMMKHIIAGTTQESSEKRFSNHSSRKTVVNKVKKANLESHCK